LIVGEIRNGFTPDCKDEANHPLLGTAIAAREQAVGIIMIRNITGIPKEYPEDALHIAVAAINGIAVIVTWNFAHLSNPFTRMMVRQIVENEGYVSPEICSPEELLENEL